jgi:hypothetical protein
MKDTKARKGMQRMTKETVVRIVMEMREGINLKSVLKWPAIKADI